MSLVSKVKLKGNLLIEVIKEGKVVRKVSCENLVTTVGRINLAKLLKAEAVTLPTHIAIGTSNIAPALSDMALAGTELTRSSLTSSIRTDNSVEYIAFFAAGVGTGTIEEAGLFNSLTSGELFARALTSTVVKAANEAISITWTITVGI